MTERKMVDVFSDIDRDTALRANPSGYAVTELGAADDRILTLTADLSNTLAEFREAFPDRYIELGIAEANSVSLAAGLASCGYVPYIFSMSPFGVLKCAEQLRTDVDYNHLPVPHVRQHDRGRARRPQRGPRADAIHRLARRPGLHPDRRGDRSRVRRGAGDRARDLAAAAVR